MYPHWKYFLTLESDFVETLRFVELDQKNYGTYSIEFVRLLLSIGSEVDVVAKQICREHCGVENASNIEDYRKAIMGKFPHLPERGVLVPSEESPLLPWSGWKNGTPPEWWRQHNDVKHGRNIHFASANLANVLYALSGLFVLCLYLYFGDARQGLLPGRPKLLNLKQGPVHLFINDNVWEIR